MKASVRDKFRAVNVYDSYRYLHESPAKDYTLLSLSTNHKVARDNKLKGKSNLSDLVRHISR